jgi:hypothetical protein
MMTMKTRIEYYHFFIQLYICPFIFLFLSVSLDGHLLRVSFLLFLFAVGPCPGSSPFAFYRFSPDCA